MVEKTVKISTIGRDGGSEYLTVDTEDSVTYNYLLQQVDMAVGSDTKVYSDEGLISQTDSLVDLNKVGTIAVSAPKIAGGMHPEEFRELVDNDDFYGSISENEGNDELETDEEEETMEEDEEPEEIPPEMQKTIKVSTIGRDGGSQYVTVHKDASVTYNYVLQQADMAVGADTKVYSDEGLINNPDSLVDLGKVSTIAVSAPKIAGGVL